jgi:hypothetical protein
VPQLSSKQETTISFPEDTPLELMPELARDAVSVRFNRLLVRRSLDLGKYANRVDRLFDYPSGKPCWRVAGRVFVSMT